MDNPTTSTDTMMSHCVSCGRHSDLNNPLAITCSNCKAAKYCQKSCQMTDWKTHNIFCGLFRELATKLDEKPLGEHDFPTLFFPANASAPTIIVVRAKRHQDGKAFLALFKNAGDQDGQRPTTLLDSLRTEADRKERRVDTWLEVVMPDSRGYHDDLNGIDCLLARCLDDNRGMVTDTPEDVGTYMARCRWGSDSDRPPYNESVIKLIETTVFCHPIRYLLGNWAFHKSFDSDVRVLTMGDVWAAVRHLFNLTQQMTVSESRHFLVVVIDCEKDTSTRYTQSFFSKSSHHYRPGDQTDAMVSQVSDILGFRLLCLATHAAMDENDTALEPERHPAHLLMNPLGLKDEIVPPGVAGLKWRWVMRLLVYRADGGDLFTEQVQAMVQMVQVVGVQVTANVKKAMRIEDGTLREATIKAALGPISWERYGFHLRQLAPHSSSAQVREIYCEEEESIDESSDSEEDSDGEGVDNRELGEEPVDAERLFDAEEISFED